MWMPSPGRDRPAARYRRDPGSDMDRAGEAAVMLAGAAALAVLWPAAAVTAAALAAATATGMHWTRLARAALWSLPMTAVYAVAAAVQDRPWAPGRLAWWAAQPYRDWKRATTDLIHGHAIPAALLAVAPAAVPAGLAAAAALWAWRCHQVAHGLAGSTALASARRDDRQWARQARAARRDARQPGRVPLTARRGVPVGTVIRAVRAPTPRTLVVPAASFTRHMVIVGITGAGKTVLMTRLWCGWYRAALRAARRGAPPPLLVAIDGKGGDDARRTAAQARAALTAAGARRVAIWPDDAALSLWDLPPGRLAVLLDQLIEHGDGAAQYYADAMAAAVRLAVHAPQGPPRTAAEFLARLTGPWLERAYAEARPAELEKVAAARPHLPSILMRYTVLLDRLGPALDGPGRLTDADAWYCILEGTAEASVAEAQGMAITELAARAAAAPGPRRRSMLLALDEFSAISRRVPLSSLYERGRSLGLGVQVSAQSWEGLGRDEDERMRIASTADGGIWLMRTPAPEKLVTLAGTRLVLEGSRKLLGPGRIGDEGSTRLAHTWIADPDRIRQLGTGQAAWIRHGAATFVQVAPASQPARDSRRDSRRDRPPAHHGQQDPAAATRPAEPPPGHEHQDHDTIPRIPRPRPPLDDALGPRRDREER